MNCETRGAFSRNLGHQGKLPLILIKGFGSMGILAICVLVFIAGLQNLQGVYQEKLDQQIHSTKVIALVNEIQLASTEVLLCRFAQTVTATPTDRDRAKSRELERLYGEILSLIATEPPSAQRQRRTEVVKEIKSYCDRIVRRSFEISPASSGGIGGLRALVGSLHTLNEIRLLFEGMGAAIIEFRAPYLHIQTDSSRELNDVKLT